MVSDTPLADAGDPAWADSPHETIYDRGSWSRSATTAAQTTRCDTWPSSEDALALLAPLGDATDALARLDARAAAASDAVRQGLMAWMAYAEAAGWLAHTHAWVHPLDLALRDLDLTASTALAAFGGEARTLPHTFADGRTEWHDQPFEAIAAGDRAVADALALARLLRRLPGARGTNPIAGATAITNLLQPLGADGLNPASVAAWWAEHARASAVGPQRLSRRGQRAGQALPPLLVAARAATAWMAGGIADHPAPAHALLAAVSLFVRTGPVRAVFVPVWAAYPAAGFGDPDRLPGLRSDVADRLVGWGQPITWPVVFLHLVGESARVGLRALDRLIEAAERGQKLTVRCDRRSRLPDAVDALLRVPALTPKALATRLHVAPQTATALLRELQAKRLIRELTGRGSFRAFAL
jgi:HTH DNA binding domain